MLSKKDNHWLDIVEPSKAMMTFNKSTLQNRPGHSDLRGKLRSNHSDQEMRLLRNSNTAIL